MFGILTFRDVFRRIGMRPLPDESAFPTVSVLWCYSQLSCFGKFLFYVL